MSTETSTEFIVLNGNCRKKFTSIDEFNKWAKGKMPNDGDEWELQEIVTTKKNHKIKSQRTRVFDKSVIKRVFDAFIEKGTVDNVEIPDEEIYVTDKRYQGLTIGQIQVYYMAEQLGYPWEKLDDLYANRDGIMNGRWEEEHRGYDTFEDREFYTNWLAPFFILAERYNVNLDDITIENYNYGNTYKYINHQQVEDPNTLANKYPDMMHYYKKNWHSGLYAWDAGIIKRMNKKDMLDLYKENLKKVNIDDVEVRYNTGDYRPCHNYTFEFRKEVSYPRPVIPFDPMPYLMFRDQDIVITNSRYYGRHVNLRNSAACDVNEDLYNYCMKNLK